MKSVLQSKKFIIIAAAIACLCGGIFMMENKAGDEIAHRIEEQLTLIGAKFDSIKVSPLGQSVEINGFKYIDERDIDLDLYIEKISLEGISFDALDVKAGDYPLVAEKISFIGLDCTYRDAFTETSFIIEEYSLLNWRQNIALIIEETEHGYASLEFLERAFTYKFDKQEAKNTKVKVIASNNNPYQGQNLIELFIESSITSWDKDDIMYSDLKNFTFILQDESIAPIEASIKEANTHMQLHKIFTPQALALLTHLSLTDNYSYSEEEMLIEMLLNQDVEEDLGNVYFSINDFMIKYDNKIILTNALFSSDTDMKNSSFDINFKDLVFTSAFYQELASDFYPFVLDMKLEEISLDYNLTAQILEDEQSISVNQDINIKDLFNIELNAVVEMLYPIESLEDNTPNKINGIYLAYTDNGFIPRSNIALQSYFGINKDQAVDMQRNSVSAFASFIPDLASATDKLFQKLGKVELTLNESLGIFDILFIPPASLNKLFTVTYTASDITLDNAINKL